MKVPTERSLDPQDWQGFRRLAHRALDDAMDMLATVEQRPVWQSVPQAVRQEFKTALPQKGAGAEAAYQDYQRLVAPYPLGNIHPRFWGWVIGTGTPMGVVGCCPGGRAPPGAGNPGRPPRRQRPSGAALS